VFVEVSQDQRYLVFQSDDFSLLGQYDMRLVVVDTVSGVRAETNFQLTIDCKVTDVISQTTLSDKETELHYTIGKPPIFFKVPSFSANPAACVKPLRLELVNTAIDGSLTLSRFLPNFISMDRSGQVTIVKTDINDG
jgi:hypothetical protein